MNFPFDDAFNTATIICVHVLEKKEPILYVTHDEDDGMWQFLCGEKHATEEARIVSLAAVYDLDSTIDALKDLPYGYYATRKCATDQWVIYKHL